MAAAHAARAIEVIRGLPVANRSSQSLDVEILGRRACYGHITFSDLLRRRDARSILALFPSGAHS
jgi:hypothetical protein